MSSYFYPAMIYYLNLKTMKQKHHEVLHCFTHTDHLTSCEYVLLSSKAKCSFNTLSHSRQSLTLQSWQEISNGPNISHIQNESAKNLRSHNRSSWFSVCSLAWPLIELAGQGPIAPLYPSTCLVLFNSLNMFEKLSRMTIYHSNDFWILNQGTQPYSWWSWRTNRACRANMSDLPINRGSLVELKQSKQSNQLQIP